LIFGQLREPRGIGAVSFVAHFRGIASDNGPRLLSPAP